MYILSMHKCDHSGIVGIFVTHCYVVKYYLSLDSICRDSYRKHAIILYDNTNGKLISFYSNIPFIFERFHDEQHAQWCEKASQKYRTRKRLLLFFLLSFFFYFRWASSKLHNSFTMVFAQNSSFLH